MTSPTSKPGLALASRIVLVTGANGGLGEQFVQRALARGAAKVYAAARSPRDWADPRITPLALDITSAASVAAAAEAARDVELVINNAAIAPADDTLAGDEDQARLILETNLFGTLRVTKAFAPVLARNGGGGLLNVLSSAAWVSMPTVYAASKAAAWSATNGLRFMLEAQGTLVTGLLVGMIDTPMSAQYAVPKSTATSVVEQAYDGLEAGALEVLADDQTRDLKAQLGTPAETLYPWMHGAIRAFLNPVRRAEAR